MNILEMDWDKLDLGPGSGRGQPMDARRGRREESVIVESDEW